MTPRILIVLAVASCSAPLPAGDRLDAGAVHLRALRPRIGATVYSRRPRLAWYSSDSSSEYRVELCRDRACSALLMTIDARGTEARPLSDLDPGLIFWRVRPRRDTQLGGWTSPSAWFVVGAGDRGDPRAARLGWRPRLQIDANGDGWTDLVLRDGTIYRSLGDRFERLAYGSLQRATRLGAVPAGDLNGDGFLDIAMPDVEGGAVWTYLGPLTRGLSPPHRQVPNPEGPGWSFPHVRDWRDPLAGDIDGDGFDDLVVNSKRASTDSVSEIGRVYLFRGEPSGVDQRATQRISVALSSRSDFAAIAVADLDGDGLDESMLLSAVSQQLPLFNGPGVMVYRGAPGGWLTPATATLRLELNRAARRGGALGDFEGSGVGGLVVQSTAEGMDCLNRHPMFLTNPDEVTRPALCGVPGRGYGNMVDAGDVDGDGRADLVVSIDAPGGAQDATAMTGCVLYRASTDWTAEPLARPADIATGPSRVGLGDVNGDGRMDAIAWATTLSGVDVALVYRGSPSGFGSPERVP